MYQLIDPLSRVIAPLSDGLLRHGLLQLGIQERYINLAGVSIHYYYRSDGMARKHSMPRQALSVAKRMVLRQRTASCATPIVFVHGLGDNALTWALVLELLAPGREVFAIDLPGYGFSGLPKGQVSASLDQICAVMEQFLRVVVGRPALVVGNSLGGWLTVRVAQRVPELMSEIMLVNAGGAYLDGRSSWEAFRDVVGVADLKTTRLAIRQVVGLVPAALIYLGQRGIQERFQREVVRSFVEQADEHDFLRPEELTLLQTPVSLIWGLQDRFLPQGSLEFFQHNLPNAPVLAIRRCGHLPQRERPLLLARYIDQRAEQLAVAH
jgi:pimeloyl-ACP methyl ester carboxylesterase